MTVSWLRKVRLLLVVGLVAGAGSTAFGFGPNGQPQSPVENYLVRGNDGGMVMPVSHEEPVSCSTGACSAVETACCGDGNSWCGTAIDYFAPGTDKCGCNTWTVGGELLLLKAFQSDGNFGDLNYEAGYRLWAAWQRPDGLGVRARLFDYSAAVAGGSAVSTTAFDVEVIDSLQLGCNWTLIVAGGIRYLDLTSSQGDAFAGLGPVATAELYRTINCNTQLYAISRYSILCDGGPNPAGNADNTLSTLELQLGIQRTRELDNGGLAFFRLGWEAQQYDDASDSEESITLSGLAFGAGVIY